MIVHVSNDERWLHKAASCAADYMICCRNCTHKKCGVVGVRGVGGGGCALPGGKGGGGVASCRILVPMEF